MFDPSLFRPSAIRHYHERQRDGVPLPLGVVPSWTGWLFVCLAAAFLLALALSISLRVEIHGTGRGVFFVGSGARSLVSPVGGRIGRVLASRGQSVMPGQLLLELDAAQVQSDLLQADRALVDQEQLTRPSQEGLDRLAQAQVHEAERRLRAQREQVESLEASVALFVRKVEANAELERGGLVSSISVAEAKEALAQARRSVNSARQSLMSAEGEVASLKARRETDNLRTLQETRNLHTRRDALAFALAQTRIVAPEAGIVEGLHARPGDSIVPGQSLGRILTGAPSPRAFALLAEKDRAQVKPGDTVRVEVDQYPLADWGAMKATILRIGASLASPTEIRELFGEGFKQEGAAYLVELDIPPGQRSRAAQRPLESGMGFQARFVLRRLRPIAFLLEPLRRWME